MDSTEQLSWILFLRLVDYFENDSEHLLIESTPVLPDCYRWHSLMAFRHDAEPTAFYRYINENLFPDLSSSNSSINAWATYSVKAIFSSLKNKISSGYVLCEVFDLVDSITLDSKDAFKELAYAYEVLLHNMVKAGGYAGEFHTTRPLIRAIVKAISPSPGSSIYDPAAGTCGFLIDAYEHVQDKISKNKESEIANSGTLGVYGNELSAHAYLLGTLNMMFHGLKSPSLRLRNTLSSKRFNCDGAERFDIVLTNPPFGSIDDGRLLSDYPIKTKALEVLFLQHVMMSLEVNGTAAVVVPERFFSRTDKAYEKIRLKLLTEFNLHTVLRLPPGTFLPYSAVKTAVLFFSSDGKTEETWFYECATSEKIGKNNPLTDDHLADFLNLYPKRSLSKQSWISSVDNLIHSFEVAAVNPAEQGADNNNSPQQILNTISGLNQEINKSLEMLEGLFLLVQEGKSSWEYVQLGSLGRFVGGRTPSRNTKEYWGGEIPWITPKDMKEPELDNSSVRLTPYGREAANMKIVPANSVLIVARSGILRHSLPVCINRVDTTINQDIKAFIPNERAVPEYIRYMLLGHEKFLLKNLTKSGVTVESIRFKEFSVQLFPVPSKEEQRKIATQLDRCFEQIFLLEKGLSNTLNKLSEFELSALAYATSAKSLT